MPQIYVNFCIERESKKCQFHESLILKKCIIQSYKVVSIALRQQFVKSVLTQNVKNSCFDLVSEFLSGKRIRIDCKTPKIIKM